MGRTHDGDLSAVSCVTVDESSSTVSTPHDGKGQSALLANLVPAAVVQRLTSAQGLRPRLSAVPQVTNCHCHWSSAEHAVSTVNSRIEYHDIHHLIYDQESGQEIMRPRTDISVDLVYLPSLDEVMNRNQSESNHSQRYKKTFMQRSIQGVLLCICNILGYDLAHQNNKKVQKDINNVQKRVVYP